MLEDEEKYNNATKNLEIHFRDWTATIPDIDKGRYYSATWKYFLVFDAQAFTKIQNASVRDREIMRSAKKEDILYGITAVSRQPDPFNYEFDYENWRRTLVRR